MKIERMVAQLGALLVVGSALLDEAAADDPPPPPSLPVEEHILLVIDRSGSMQTLRAGSLNETRFQTAIDRSVKFVGMLSPMPRHYSIWSFEGATYVKHLDFTSSVADAQQVLTGMQVGSGATPLAYTLCDAVDEILGYKQGVQATKVIHLFSDGEENASPSGSECQGPGSSSGYPLFTQGSWQWKVLNKFRTGDAADTTPQTPPLVLDVDVFYDYILLAGSKGAVSEVSPHGSLVAPPAANLSASYFSFLEGLAAESGGTFTTIVDSLPAPVFGDTNQDYCVDIYDYNLILQNYGRHVPPASPEADLNNDGIVDYYDYSLVVSNYGSGSGCP